LSATAASFLILTVALLGGFAWWERSRPPSRLLALVATVAALAAIGRIAFAPIPNVKPTTDIVLFAGFALGAAPGFAVGAVAALSSNFFFGQGPWTPWQMAAWGLVGLLGAGLARVLPRAGRVPLALACAFAGLLYGEILNVSVWITYSDHSLAGLLAYVGRGVPFDVAHVIGNVLFCLAFGPAFVAALGRFQTRMHVRWIPVVAALALLAFAPLAVAAPTTKPTRYLLRAQNADGGFGAAPGEASSPLYSAWAILGLVAAGRHPADVRHGGDSALAYLRAHGDEGGDPGGRARAIMALAASGEDAPELIGRLQEARRPDGSYAGRVNTTAFAIFALEGAGARTGLRGSAHWIASQQNPDGGFNFAGKGGQSGIDDTSAPLQALVAVGGHRKAVRRAARFLVRRENPDGGFPLSPGGPSNAQSTAWAVQALVAVGRNSDRARSYLHGLTAPSGAVRYSRTSTQTPVWVTAQALSAFARKPFPLRPVSRRSAPLAPTPAATPAPSETKGTVPTVPPGETKGTVPTVPLRRIARRAGRLTALVL
jgi:energy-coupling factor transport system substrate-specific component